MRKPNLHTHGPWEIGQGNGEGSIFAKTGRMRLDAGGTTLYSVCRVTMDWNDKEDMANLLLIHAAPDLLRVCQEIANDSKVDLGTNERHFRLYSAIQKATGDL